MRRSKLVKEVGRCGRETRDPVDADPRGGQNSARRSNIGRARASIEVEGG